MINSADPGPGQRGLPSTTLGLQAIRAIEPRTRRELILARLREAISTGQLPPGTHLAEVELSEALGVSRGTLREALRHLQQEGLVTADGRNRLSVRMVKVREVREIFDVRCALETLAFRELCAAADRGPVVADLSEQLEKLRAAEGDIVAQLEADLGFHRRLCELSGNQTLLHTWLAISGLARAAITAAGTPTALHNMAYERHHPIVRLIEGGDLDAGAAFLDQHMSEAAHRIIEGLNKRDADVA